MKTRYVTPCWVSFKMNPPSASHIRGSWERQIRTVQSVLGSLLEKAGQQLDDESFRTLLKEVQAGVNSRPLALNDMSSPDSPEPLTPNHLLTMKSKVVMPPPGVFLREDLYLRRRWRRAQHLANVFWERWRKAFLHTLQLRKRWIKPQRNMAVNDVVIVKDENVPRNAWRLTRVEEVFSSHDGLVRKVRSTCPQTSSHSGSRPGIPRRGAKLRRQALIEGAVLSEGTPLTETAILFMADIYMSFRNSELCCCCRFILGMYYYFYVLKAVRTFDVIRTVDSHCGEPCDCSQSSPRAAMFRAIFDHVTSVFLASEVVSF